MAEMLHNLFRAQCHQSFGTRTFGQDDVVSSRFAAPPSLILNPWSKPRAMVSKQMAREAEQDSDGEQDWGWGPAGI